MSASASTTQLRIHLVGRIALLSGVAATVVLLGTIYWITREESRDYQEMIGAFLRAEDQLAKATLVFGLFAAALAGVTTWMLTLFTSFRVAGPLFRFSRNLEAELERGPVEPVPIRKGDALQQEAAAFGSAVQSLRRHYDDLHAALKEVERLLDDDRNIKKDSIATAIERLREIDNRARL